MENILIHFIDFMEMIFNSALDIWEFLTTEINILNITFTPLGIIGSVIGVLLLAWFIKKLVPVA